MTRGFKESDRFERGWVVPPVDREEFTVTAATPSRPSDELDGPTATALPEGAPDLATAAFDNAPALPRTFDRRDLDSDTLAIAAPSSPLPVSDHTGLRDRRSRSKGHDPRSMAPKMGAPRVVGRYRLSEPIANGGMATVHLGVRTDADHRVYAVKRLHERFAHDSYFAQMLLDEAAIAARIRHQNVVTMYGAGMFDSDLILVMEYVVGLTVAELIGALHPQTLPARIATAIFAGALRGLHAAHEAYDEHGRSLDIIHRDVAPQNIHLGADGIARVLDFGIAKAEHRTHETRFGELKGKMAYMAPEQLTAMPVDRRVDIHAAAVVMWEALAAAPLFHAENESATMARVLEGCSTPPSALVAGIPPELDAIVMRGLARHPDDRFQTALEMAEALEAVFADDTPPSHEIAAWLAIVAGDTMREQWDARASLLGEGAAPPPRRRPIPIPTAPVPPQSANMMPGANMMLLDPSSDRNAMTERHSMRRHPVPTVPVRQPEILPDRWRYVLAGVVVFVVLVLIGGLIGRAMP
jgi:serine/threonine-protein kinase